MEQGSNDCTLKVAYIKDGFVLICTRFPESMLFFRLEILPIFRIFQIIFRTSYVCLDFWTSGRCRETWAAELTEICTFQILPQ